jgi:hypothetical protein
VQRGPYSAYHDQDGPTERLYLPEDEFEPDEPLPANEHEDEPRTRGVFYALVIAILALVVSGGAAVTAFQARNRADRAVGSMAVPHQPVVVPQPSAITPSATAPSAAPSSAAASTPLLYAQEPLEIQADCDSATLIDLDEPLRVDAPEQQSDLRYDNRCGGESPMLSIAGGAAAGSHVSDPDTDRPGCAEAIRENPLEKSERIPVRKGTVLCVSAAATLALVEVTGVGEDGTISLRATGWNPPADPAATGSADSAPATVPDRVPSDDDADQTAPGD